MRLEVRDLVAGYGNVHIVRGVSFTVDAGESVALLGRNGVGKTTLLRSIFGLAERYDGEIRVDGEVIPPNHPETLARRSLTLVPDDRGVFPRLTVAENLRLASRNGGWNQQDPLQFFPELRDRLQQPARELSGGLQQQLAIARAFATRASLIAIDELSQGLQPSIIQTLEEALHSVSTEVGTALLIVEQNLDLALRLCHRAVVLQKGQIVLDESAEVIRSNKDQYLDLLAVS